MIVSYSQAVETNRGRNNFLRNLFKILREKFNVNMCLGTKGDIHLAFPMEPLKHRTKNIVRIDGVYYDRAQLDWNARIRLQMAQADGIVFQSEWSRVFARRMLGVREKDSVVIYNGTDPQSFKNHNVDKMGFDKVFLACAHWRPNKRLDAILDSFHLVASRSQKKLGLFIIGEGHNRQPFESVVYFGDLPHDRVCQVYASADYFVHVCHLESCSNAVVDALVCGLPVLCNNIGGTPEIVADSGLVANIDSPFDFSVVPNMESVGSSCVDCSLLAHRMEQMISTEWDIYRPDLHLERIALGYFEYFKKVLSS